MQRRAKDPGPAWAWQGLAGVRLGQRWGGSRCGLHCWALGLHWQRKARVLTPPTCAPTSSAREGPELDVPGKERQERARGRMDSESLDEEDS